MLRLSVCALLTLAVAGPSVGRGASAAVRPSPRVVLLVAARLDAQALLKALGQPRWSRLRTRVGFGLLNANVIGPATPAGSLRTLLLGRRVRAGGDMPAVPDGLEVITVGGDPLAALDALERRAGPPGVLLMLTSPDTGAPTRNSWTRLAPLLVVGPNWAGRAATSATTRTAGLVANVDVLPTALSHLGLPLPPHLEGHVLRPTIIPGGLDGLRALARHTAATHDLMTPVMLAWGAFAFAAILTAILGVARGGPLASYGRVLLAIALAVAPALLLAAAWPAAGPADLALRLFLLTVGLAIAAWIRRRRSSPVLTLLGVISALCLFDLLARTGMLAGNLMSDFPNVGSRFYGIGNEWEGLLLAATLVLPFWCAGMRGSPGSTSWDAPARVAAMLLWTVTLVAVGLPPFGADLGGAVTFALAYAVAGAVFAVPGVATGRIVLRLAAGLALTAVAVGSLVAFDLARPPAVRTHIGNFAARALAGEWGPVLDMIGRKVALNLDMARSPYFLLGVAAALPLVMLLRARVSDRLADLFTREPALTAGLKALLAGALLGLVLNDTGVVTWGLCTATGLVVLLDRLLAARDARTAGTPACV